MHHDQLLVAKQRFEEALGEGWSHYLYLLLLALVVYGHTLAFGLFWDDRRLLGEAGAAWLSHPWSYHRYYRPLQVLFFHRSVVTNYPPFLHLQNIVVGTLVVFLFGSLLTRFRFTFWQRVTIESIGIALPTSMWMFVWISQRTSWVADIALLYLLVLTFSRTLPFRLYLASFVMLFSIALLTKESAVSIPIVVAPFVLLVHRQRRRAWILALAGLVIIAGWHLVRCRILTFEPVFMKDPLAFFVVTVLGLMESVLYSYVQVCYTYNPFCLVLNAAFMALGFIGVFMMCRRERTMALGLAVLFLGASLGTAPVASPRNLAIPGLVAFTFAGYGLWRICEGRWHWKVKSVACAVAIANIVVVCNVAVFYSYPLQDWIEQANTIAAKDLRRAGLDPHRFHPTNRFQRNLRLWAKECYFRMDRARRYDVPSRPDLDHRPGERRQDAIVPSDTTRDEGGSLGE